MDRKQIRKALDHFENDEYVDAKEIIKQEVNGHRDIFLKNKIGLKNDINPEPDAKGDDKDDKDEGSKIKSIDDYLTEKGGRNKMPTDSSGMRADIEKADDKKLLAFYKKLNKATNIDANTWNMVIDELEKRGLKK